MSWILKYNKRLEVECRGCTRSFFVEKFGGLKTLYCSICTALRKKPKRLVREILTMEQDQSSQYPDLIAISVAN